MAYLQDGRRWEETGWEETGWEETGWRR